MFFFFVRLSLPAGLLLTAAVASAQPAQAPQEAGAPLGSGGLAYVSVFENYRGWQELPISSWPEVNRNVRDIGGWRSYAKQARTPGSGAGRVELPSPESMPHRGDGALP